MSKKKSPEAKRARRVAEIEALLLDVDLRKKQRKALRTELSALSGEFVPTVASGITAPAQTPETAADLVAINMDEVFETDAALAERRTKQDAEVATQWAHQQSLADRWRLEDLTGIASDLIVEEKPTPIAVSDVLEAPADPVLENGNGQAMIHYLDPTTGLEKVKGYTRVTTYIDGLDDKTVLTKWKMRTLLEGAAVESLSDLPEDERAVSKVARSVKRTDEALHDIDSREREEGELLELRRQELLKEHRTLLEGIAEELMELGGAHEKANKGTNLHRLTQIVDEGGVLPADTTATDRRDVEAYQAKMAELDLKVLWCERRVVLDDIQVSGTMDRAYQMLLPGMQRRIRVVGDLKTGSVDWGRAKIGMQLALYARGFGYDWAKPLERERLSLSKAHGLLIHLPQGEGRCEVYLVDLELAAKGLDLARQVREWRNAGKRVYDLKKPLVKP